MYIVWELKIVKYFGINNLGIGAVWLIEIEPQFEMLQFINRKACDVDQTQMHDCQPRVAVLLTNRVSTPPFSPISNALANWVNTHH